MSIPVHVQPGDVIRSDDWNKMIDFLSEIFDYNHVENVPQPIQVDKPSILVLIYEGTATVGFPTTVHVYLSELGVIFEEIGAGDIPRDGETYAGTLVSPIPKDWFVKWIAPYGFVKSAVLF
jgi:hypothetical protein